jgi:hypothetical protein
MDLFSSFKCASYIHTFQLAGQTVVMAMQPFAPPQRQAVRTQVIQRATNQAGLAVDANTLCFPHPYCSLTHTRQTMLAAAMGPPLSDCRVGIDLETQRTLRLPAALRFYAHPNEVIWWQHQTHAPQQAALQLWTQNEAAYKAFGFTHRNLNDLCVHNPYPCQPHVTQPVPWQVSHPSHPEVQGHGLTWAGMWQGQLHWLSCCVLVPA